MNGKKCPFCKEYKIYDDFYSSNKSKDGYASYCKVCRAIYKKIRGHGISREEYNLIITSSDVCEICFKKCCLNIDHDHKTGLVRGLLCNRCNYILGIIDNNLDNINNYLTRKPKYKIVSRYNRESYRKNGRPL